MNKHVPTDYLVTQDIASLNVQVHMQMGLNISDRNDTGGVSTIVTSLIDNFTIIIQATVNLNVPIT